MHSNVFCLQLVVALATFLPAISGKTMECCSRRNTRFTHNVYVTKGLL